MKHFFFMFFAGVVTSGCVLVQDEWFTSMKSAEQMRDTARSYSVLPPPKTVSLGTQTVYRRNYVLNQPMVAKVGETVLRVQAFHKETFETAKMRLNESVKVKLAPKEFTLPAKEYPLYGIFENNGKTFFVLPKINKAYLLVDMDGYLQNRFLYEIRGSNKVSYFDEKLTFQPSAPRMTREIITHQQTLPFADFEVIYDGIKNDQIILFHKENVPGTNGAKGSFDTYAYPADSTMISVDGMLLRIIRAGKDQLDYIVIRQ